jgi:flagellar hook assembly protein FlgD
LGQNYPNPFNSETRIRYSLPKACPVSLRVFDVNGRMVRSLKAGMVSAGSYEIVWDGKNDSGDVVPTGIYIMRLDAGGNVFTKKMAFVK